MPLKDGPRATTNFVSVHSWLRYQLLTNLNLALKDLGYL